MYMHITRTSQRKRAPKENYGTLAVARRVPHTALLQLSANIASLPYGFQQNYFTVRCAPMSTNTRIIFIEIYKGRPNRVLAGCGVCVLEALVGLYGLNTLDSRLL